VTHGRIELVTGHNTVVIGIDHVERIHGRTVLWCDWCSISHLWVAHGLWGGVRNWLRSGVSYWLRSSVRHWLRSGVCHLLLLHLRDVNNSLDVLDLRNVHLADLLLNDDLGDVSHNLMCLNRARHVDVLLNDLHLWYLNDPLDMLDLWDVDFMYLFLRDEFRDVPDLLDDLDWAWHVNMPLDHLYLRHFDNSFHMLNLRHMDLNYLLFRDRHMNMPDNFPRLDWPRNVNVALRYVHLRHLDVPILEINWFRGRGDWWQGFVDRRTLRDRLYGRRVHGGRLHRHRWCGIGYGLGRRVGHWCTIVHSRRSPVGHGPLLGVHRSVELLAGDDAIMITIELIEGARHC